MLPPKYESRKGSPLIQGGGGNFSELLLRLLFLFRPLLGQHFLLAEVSQRLPPNNFNFYYLSHSYFFFGGLG